MNRIYRLVWRRSLGALVVASELAASGRVGEASRGVAGGRAWLRFAAVLGALGLFPFSAVHAQSVGDAKLADLRSLVAKYDDSRPAAGTPVAARVTGSRMPLAVRAGQRAAASIDGLPHELPRPTRVARAETVRADVHSRTATAPAAVVAKPDVVAAAPAPGKPQVSTPRIVRAVSGRHFASLAKASAGKRGSGIYLEADSAAGLVAADDPAPLLPRKATFAATAQLAFAPWPQAPLLGSFAPMMSSIVYAVPVVPPPDPSPTGLIVGNGGVVGTVVQLLGPSANSLFNNSDGYVTNGSLHVSNVNFTQGYSTLDALGLPVLNLTPVGTVLTSTGGEVVGGTGINSHLTLLGGVTSDSYIRNINNGAAGGLLGLALPSGAPAWASTCLNVLGVLTESCWGVNAAQDYQVLVGDGASANGSKEVVIGTNASHTLASVDASTAFPGSGLNDPNNPSGVPTADYEARLGHSVVIGDDASGTANAQTILGAEATASVANSVALGYRSAADRGAMSGYSAFGLAAPQDSAGEVSVGASGQERQITHVAAGSASTDAVNVAQLQAVGSQLQGVDVLAVKYDADVNGNPLNTVTLLGDGSGADVGITHLAAGSVTAGSTDAINGSQLAATNAAVAGYFGGTTAFDPASGLWTAPTFSITSIAADGSASSSSYGNVTDAFAAVDGSLGNLNSRIVSIASGGGIKYFHATSTLADSTASGNGSVAIGGAAQAGGTGSVAMGDGATAAAAGTLALGAGASASLANSIALGAGSATQVGALSNYAAYGLAAPQSSLGEVNLGNRQVTGVAAGSAADDAVNVAQLQAVGSQLQGVDALAVKYDADVNGNPLNTVTLLGDGSGADVGITHLAAGSVTAGSTDAINGSQLAATNAAVAGYFGGTTAFDPAGGLWTAPTFSITSIAADGSASSSSYGNVTDAFAAVDGSLSNLNNRIVSIASGGIKYFHATSTLADSTASGNGSVAIGGAAQASGDGSVAMGDGAAASATGALALGTGASASLANSIALGAGSATQVGALSNYAAYGLAAPQSSLGEVNLGNRQVTGVAAGSAADDAVNVAQLQAVDSRVQSVDQLAVKYDADVNGNPLDTITLLGDGSGAPVGIFNVAAGAETAASLGAVNGSQLWHWTQDAGNAYSNYNLYNDIAQLTQSSSGKVKYLSVNSTLGDASASGANSIALGPVAAAGGSNSVAVGNGATADADNAVALGAGSVADRASTVSVGSVGGERQITHVAAGTAGTDAVNVDQMNASVAASTQGAVHYDTRSDGSIDYDNVTLGNGGGATGIHNVAAGVADGDAVNVGQFNAGVRQAVDWANAYTNQQVRKLGNRANAGVAAAMAMAGLPQAYEPGRSMAAVSAGNFRGESSLAIGVSTISEGGRWVYKLTGSTDTRGDTGVSIGAGIQW